MPKTSGESGSLKVKKSMISSMPPERQKPRIMNTRIGEPSTGRMPRISIEGLADMPTVTAVRSIEQRNTVASSSNSATRFISPKK